MKIKSIILLAITFILAACGDSPSESYSEKKVKDERYTIVDSLSAAKSKIFLLIYNEELDSNEKIEKISKKIANDSISDGFSNISLYFFNNKSNLPDLSGLYDYANAIDYLYDGSHSGWDYIYQNPIVGSPRLINCSIGDHTVCK